MLLLLLRPWRKVHAMSQIELVHVGLPNVKVVCTCTAEQTSCRPHVRTVSPVFQPISHSLTFVHILGTHLLTPTLTVVMVCAKLTRLSCEAL